MCVIKNLNSTASIVPLPFLSRVRKASLTCGDDDDDDDEEEEENGDDGDEDDGEKGDD